METAPPLDPKYTRRLTLDHRAMVTTANSKLTAGGLASRQTDLIRRPRNGGNCHRHQRPLQPVGVGTHIEIGR